MVWIVLLSLLYLYIQGQADSKDCKDCDLTPHYTDTTSDVTSVSFKSPTNDSATIRVEKDGRITISTETTADNSDTQFKIVNVNNVSVNS